MIKKVFLKNWIFWGKQLSTPFHFPKERITKKQSTSLSETTWKIDISRSSPPHGSGLRREMMKHREKQLN